MGERFPDYDVLAKRDTASWNAQTRAAIDRRLAIRDEPRFFTAGEWLTLSAVCDRIMPQPKDRPPVPLPAYVDAKMADKVQDGFRYADLPEQGEAWKRGLAGLDEAALAARQAFFHALAPAEQDALLRHMQAGDLRVEALGDMPAASFFKHRLLPDVTHAYYAHPTAWNEIGFGGPASPRGYVRLALDRRDPWEAAEARSGKEEIARRANDRVG